ncbi:MAG TPA: GTP-binding protein [Mariprofundaceae bacterium]|nr:GTP-binding protein [Mariprofundaceae bacterium]
MQLKVFTASQLHEALAQVREALGPDALILDRQAEPDGQGGKQWKVYAAVDQPVPPEPPMQGGSAPRNSEPPAFLHTVSRLERLIDGLARQDVAGLRNSLDAPARQGFDTLIKLGTAPNYAYELAPAYAEGMLPDSGLIQWGPRLEPKKRREVVTLFGPSGGGKTLMAARLATHFSLKGVSVALLSLDMDRIAANAQLSAYADILGIPFLTARNEQEAEKVCAGKDVAAADLLLIDSEGICCQRPRKLQQLAEQMERLPATRRFLVMPANLDEEESMAMNQVAACFSPTDLVFSKLDETARPGKVVNLAVASSLPLSYCSFGPEVPDHLGWLSPKSLMSLLSSREREALGRTHERVA